MSKYEIEILNEYDDDGTMPNNVSKLSDAVIGHRIVSAALGTVEGIWRESEGLILTLDDGTQVELADDEDCCAYTKLKGFFAHPEMVNHVITGVGTTHEYTKWHIYADFGDVLTLDVEWSCGNPFYYSYGFYITVKPLEQVD